MQQTPNSDYPEWFKNRKSGITVTGPAKKSTNAIV